MNQISEKNSPNTFCFLILYLIFRNKLFLAISIFFFKIKIALHQYISMSNNFIVRDIS